MKKKIIICVFLLMLFSKSGYAFGDVNLRFLDGHQEFEIGKLQRASVMITNSDEDFEGELIVSSKDFEVKNKIELVENTSKILDFYIPIESVNQSLNVSVKKNEDLLSSNTYILKTKAPGEFHLGLIGELDLELTSSSGKILGWKELRINRLSKEQYSDRFYFDSSDFLIISEEGLDRLEDENKKNLLSWIRGGGILFISGEDSGYKNEGIGKIVYINSAFRKGLENLIEQNLSSTFVKNKISNNLEGKIKNSQNVLEYSREYKNYSFQDFKILLSLGLIYSIAVMVSFKYKRGKFTLILMIASIVGVNLILFQLNSFTVNINNLKLIDGDTKQSYEFGVVQQKNDKETEISIGKQIFIKTLSSRNSDMAKGGLEISKKEESIFAIGKEDKNLIRNVEMGKGKLSFDIFPEELKVEKVFILNQDQVIQLNPKEYEHKDILIESKNDAVNNYQVEKEFRKKANLKKDEELLIEYFFKSIKLDTNPWLVVIGNERSSIKVESNRQNTYKKVICVKSLVLDDGQKEVVNIDDYAKFSRENHIILKNGIDFDGQFFLDSGIRGFKFKNIVEENGVEYLVYNFGENEYERIDSIEYPKEIYSRNNVVDIKISGKGKVTKPIIMEVTDEF